MSKLWKVDQILRWSQSQITQHRSRPFCPSCPCRLLYLSIAMQFPHIWPVAFHASEIQMLASMFLKHTFLPPPPWVLCSRLYHPQTSSKPPTPYIIHPCFRHPHQRKNIVTIYCMSSSPRNRHAQWITSPFTIASFGLFRLDAGCMLLDACCHTI